MCALTVTPRECVIQDSNENGSASWRSQVWGLASSRNSCNIQLPAPNKPFIKFTIRKRVVRRKTVCQHT